mgnify:CR=1 FL=1
MKFYINFRYFSVYYFEPVKKVSVFTKNAFYPKNGFWRKFRKGKKNLESEKNQTKTDRIPANWE